MRDLTLEQIECIAFNGLAVGDEFTGLLCMARECLRLRAALTASDSRASEYASEARSLRERLKDALSRATRAEDALRECAEVLSELETHASGLCAYCGESPHYSECKLAAARAKVGGGT